MHNESTRAASPDSATSDSRASRVAIPDWLTDAVVAAAMVGLIACVTYLGARVRRLQDDAVTLATQANEYGTTAATLRRTLYLTRLAAKPLPPPLRLAVATATGTSSANGIVVMLFTQSACEKSIKDGLESLKGAQGRLAKTGIRTVALAGATSTTEREQALIGHAEGGFTFPLVFSSRADLAASIFPADDPTFSDEPVYLRLDREGRVVGSVHGDQRHPEFLDTWLRGIQ